MNLSDVKIYRMVHIANVRHMLEFGITHKSSPSRNPNFVSIGDTSVITSRSSKTISVRGVKTADLTINLKDYIPFYFGVKIPMLYVIQNGGNYVASPIVPSKIVYIVCDLISVVRETEEFYFSDGHALDSLTTFYDVEYLDDLTKIDNWTAIKTSYWGGHENLDLKREKQAEVLIKGDIPVELIIGVGCYDKGAKQYLMEEGVSKDIIRVIPKAYF